MKRKVCPACGTAALITVDLSCQVCEHCHTEFVQLTIWDAMPTRYSAWDITPISRKSKRTTA